MKRPLRLGFFTVVSFAALVTACGWDPSRPFDRDAPEVDEALRHLGDGGEAGVAADLLESYLATGACTEGNIGTPPRLRERPNGSFDLGLALFRLAETYGHRFGDEEEDAGASSDPSLAKLRTAEIDCALRVVRAVAEDLSQPLDLRARARYLEGNLLFLSADYKGSVAAYDRALELAPGMGDAGPIGSNPDAGAARYGSPDPIGRDAAWNRAVALRRIEDKKDAGSDASSDGGEHGDGGKNDDDKNKDSGKDDKGNDAGNDDKNQNKDAGKDDKGNDAGKDSGAEEPPKKPEGDDKDKKPPPPPSRQSQDDRILDQFENAPTVQQELAKRAGKARKVRGTADK